MAVNLSPVGGVAAQFFDNNGVILSGGKIYTYAAGTTTNQATYTSAAGTTAHTNPIILDSAGRVPSGEIWLTDGLQYKFVIKNANDVTIGTYDNVIGINSNFVNFVTETEIQTATAGQTVFTLTTMQYQPGTNNLSVFVDGVNQYDGVSYSYVETSSTVVTFTAGLHVGALVKFTTAATLSTGVTDASLVTYDPPFGSSSVPTNVEAKLAQVISVKDFGAVGDGLVDDTAAIQAAIDYVATLPNGGKIYYPAGSYLVSSPLEVQNVNVSQIGDGIFSTVIVTNTDIETMIIGSNPIESLEGVDVTDIGFFHTNAVGKTKPHLVLLSVEQSTFKVRITNGKYGIACYGGQGITFDKVFAPGNYVASSATLNSAEGIILRSASEATGYTIGTSAVELPTEVNFRDIYINGPRLAGWQYGVAIYAGEHITFSGDWYVGQSIINNIHIEQTAANKLILEVKMERGGYVDAAGDAAIWIGGPLGNGSQYIGSISIDCDVKGQSGDGLKGIYIDGTSRGGGFPQAVRNFSFTGNVSGFSTHGIEVGGGVNMAFTGAKVWGNSLAGANQGYGLTLGAAVTVCNVSGGHFGGGTYGDGTGNQTAGIGVDPAAYRVTLNGVDLRGNQTALVWTNNADTRLNQVFNCAGFNGQRTPVLPAMASSGVDYTNPYGSPASVIIYGGTVSSIKLNGVKMFSTTVNAPIVVGMNDVINVTYTVAPTWIWWPQ